MKKLSLFFVAIGAWSLSFGQNVGVDVATPLQKLDVAGAIRIAGNGATGNAGGGDIRYNTTSNEIQYYNGTTWVSMTSNTDDQEVTTLGLSGTELQFQLEGDVNGLQTLELEPLQRQLIDGPTNGDNTWIRVATDAGANNDIVRVTTAGSERLRIDATGQVGIGTNSPSNPLHLEVAASGFNIPLFIRNKTGSAGNGVGIGFITETNNSNAVSKAAIYHQRTTNFGVGALHFLVNNDAASNSSTSLSDARMTILPDGNVGIGQTSPTYKLHVNGKLKTTGVNETSDARLKKNVQNINDALNKILSMRGVTYDWKVSEYPEMALTEGVQYGVLAQELEKIIPELVGTDSEGWKSVEYSHLVPVLIEAIKEQQKIIESHGLVNSNLQKSYDALSAKVDVIENQLLIGQSSAVQK